MNEFFLRYLIPSAVAGTFGMAAVLLFLIFRKKVSVSTERAALIGAAVLFLLPFRLFAGWIPAPAAEPSETAIADAALTENFFYRIGESAAAALPEKPADAAEPQIAGEPDALFAARAVLPFLYAAVSLGLLARGLLRYAVFKRKLDRSLFAPAGWQEETLLELCREAGLKNPPSLYRSALVSVPILSGIFSPVIVFPKDEIPAYVFRAALRHELEHLVNRDLPAKALAGLVCCIHWFNPAAYLLRGRLANVLELRSDERAAGFPERRRFQYAEAILWFSGDARRFPATGFAARSKRKVWYRMERILHPVRPSRRRNALFSAVTVLFLVGGLLAGCNVAGGAGEQPVSPDDNPQSTQEPADNHWADLYGRPGGGVSSISDVDLLGDPLYPFSIPNRLLHGEWNGAGEPIPVRVSAPDDCYRPGGMTSIPVAVKIGQGDPQPDGFGLFVPEDHALTLTVDAIPDTISLSAAESGDIRYFEDIDGGTYAVLGYAVDVDSVPVYTLYARLDEVMVKNGEYADAGQELGKIRISGDDSSDTGFIGFQFFVAFHNTSKLFVLPGAAGAVSGTLETPLLFPSETSQFISRWSSSVADGDPYDHMAIDIDGSIGSGILAADRGVVAAAGFDPVRGYFVLLEHAEGFQTLYTHLSESFVEEGDEVARGDIIAAMGNSGQSTGPHLHFEVILDGAAQKPEDYLGNPPGR